MNNSQFVNNKALIGGGGAIHSVLGNMQINTSLFRNNQAMRPGYSGAIYSDGTLADRINGYSILRKSRFFNNSGEGQGGAVFLYLYPHQTGSKGLIEECEFIGNKVVADQKGDALGGDRAWYKLDGVLSDLCDFAKCPLTYSSLRWSRVE